MRTVILFATVAALWIAGDVVFDHGERIHRIQLAFERTMVDD